MNRVVLITGASRGIGAQCARAFAQNGDRVAINYQKSGDKARALAEQIARDGGQAALFQADVSDKEQVFAMVEKVKRLWGRIDVLICNAGISMQKLLIDTTPDEWRRMMAVNLDGAYYCAYAVLPSMLSEKSGCIVTISSIWGIAGASCEVAYSASKAGLIGLTKALAKEVGLSGVRVNCVAPGVIDTDMNAGLDERTIRELKEETPLGVIGDPRDIADAVFFLASDKARFITGQVLSPNGGYLI